MIVPKGTLIMVVDGARMLLYRNDGKALAPELALVDSTEDPTPQTAELGSDRPGRRFESVGTGRGAYEGPDYHQQAEDRFSHEAAARLNDLADQGEGQPDSGCRAAGARCHAPPPRPEDATRNAGLHRQGLYWSCTA